MTEDKKTVIFEWQLCTVNLLFAQARKSTILKTEIRIERASNLTIADITILRRYLSQSNQFSDNEWQQVRIAIDKLARSSIVYGDRQYSFQHFYETFINGTYARPFLSQLQGIENLQQQGSALQADNARKIVAWLSQNGISARLIADADLLIVYCLYWWAAFARGYLFEQEIIRDLTTKGIRFEAHQSEYGQQRYTLFDLVVFGMGNGDIKTSTYFLEDLRNSHVDFYITRLYDSRLRKNRLAVFLSPISWQQINGKPKMATVAGAVKLFPLPVLVEIIGRNWVIAEYEVWKERVLIWQQRRSKNGN